MVKKDVSAVHKLLQDQTEKYKIKYKMSHEDIMHHILPKDDIVWSYVIENEVDGKLKVTDFFAMNRLEQLTESREKFGHTHMSMYSGTMSYYGLTLNKLEEIMKEVLWIAKEELKCDAFSVQTLMDNTPDIFENLGFLKGDGALHYYIVNWSFGNNVIESNDIGTILV